MSADRSPPILVAPPPPSSARKEDAGSEGARREELAAFLRTKREGTRPEERGLRPIRSRRRTPGLLREEVADLAGVSVTWYTWIEQARPTNPSAMVLEGLTNALGLSPAEREHLFRLARPDLDPTTTFRAAMTLPPALLATLHGLAPHPAYATNARWDVLAWNEPATKLFGDFSELESPKRNILWRLVHDSSWRTLFVDWETLVRSAIAQFRATTVRLQVDPDLAELVDELTASPIFRATWHDYSVALPMACQKTLRVNDALLAFDYSTFKADSPQKEDDVRFTIYTPCDAETAERLAAL